MISASKLNNTGFKWVLIGFIFTLLWSSASTATKIGLKVAQPLTIALMRFLIASVCMLIYAHIIRGYPLPGAREWKKITIYGIFNITIYLGLYVLAMKDVTAGIGALAIATSPIFIGLLSVIVLKQIPPAKVIAALLLGLLGVVVAAWPLLHGTGVSVKGLVILLIGMLSYSLASIYFNKTDWQGLKILTINGWQTLIGGMLLLPFLCMTYHKEANHFTADFWISSGWLAIFVSIAAIQCWLWLLKSAPIKAGMWLYLCPIFGFIIAAVFMDDPLSLYTLTGVVMVLLALVMVRGKRPRQKAELQQKQAELTHTQQSLSE
ncbi:Permease of the drug/metabolite transporter (DMT) superfamily [Arachidicoccus rhizosphaerae]|uniref:Permease of the drug/metabolite transporter (DMT) superfamily n=1 Tax=Arachidicoccus rhizosphaerae TaxID=551991 RepID=A0A1H3ZLK7_9BACT|nr:EamA family transporter [Arachidicoccus rhizosphaerae]SEA24560.1 Permease of the drug/metabolite transporter (DMT) superfamily [Arachidicoccus rhizosphaerae]